jgi:DNA-binding transcriptional ArsR family regulator
MVAAGLRGYYLRWFVNRRTRHRVSDLYHPRLEDVGLANVLRALSDPVRLEIVRVLAGLEEAQCSSLNVAVSKSTMSHHFKVLREAGVTQTRANGTQRLISLRRNELEEHFPGLLDSVLQAAKAA